ncbi:MAG: DNA polymerase III subunit beta [Bacilli bacterium]|jgi:DNA polymerase-3 subunit beta
MNFSIKKDILLDGLLNVSRALSTKNLIPILSGIKFELKKNGLYLTGSDNDITIQSFIENKKENISNLENEGSIVIQGKYIVEIIRKLPDEIVNIELIDGLKVLIYTKNAKFNLNGMDPTEYPKLDLQTNNKPIILDKKILKNIVNQTSFAASNQETRPLLTGINFKISNNKLECIATDSYRLAKKIIKLDGKNEDNNIIIPSRNLVELTKILLDNDDEKVEMYVFSNKIIFKFDNIIFQSRLLNGTYPDTSKLIPEEYSLSIITNPYELYDVIDRASLLMSDREKNIVNLDINKNNVKITSNSPEIGKVEETMDVENENKETLKISFSATYMMESLRAIQSDRVKILFNGEMKPIILKNPDDDNLIQLILPIRTY